MLGRDFFAFCTSLKPLELKAIGELSSVRRLPGGETIYRAGDRSDALYIINRGMVELAQQNSESPAPGTGTYLSRGDIFGDVDLLTNLPRAHLVRTCEQVSLQRFDGDDLPELLRRVPSFFRYLSEHLASRLVQARDVALAQSHCLELSGSLANFDLITVFQTIVNSSQTGELSILDERHELVCAFYFESGHPRGGQFQHLTGEEAFWQLFLTEDLRGTFSFSSKEQPVTQSIKLPAMTRSAGDMLITALQSSDELKARKAELGDAFPTVERFKNQLSLDEISPEPLRPLAKQIWDVSGIAPFVVRSLYPRFHVCELKIYQAVAELIRTKHLSLSSIANAQKVA